MDSAAARRGRRLSSVAVTPDGVRVRAPRSRKSNLAGLYPPARYDNFDVLKIRIASSGSDSRLPGYIPGNPESRMSESARVHRVVHAWADVADCCS